MEIKQKILSKSSFEQLVTKLIKDGNRVIAPVKEKDQVNFREIKALSEMDNNHIVTKLSAKSVVFPKVEVLFEFEKTKENTSLKEVSPDTIPNSVLLGVRPCDAYGFSPLTAIFTWDYKDNIYSTRLEKTTIIGLSCTNSDEFCFCTSVYGGPGNTTGSDILLTPMKNGDYLAEIVTDKGEKLVSVYPDLFSATEEIDKKPLLADVPVRFDLKNIQDKLPELFKDEKFWEKRSLECLGCGACAFVCPTCACFDIQDEKNKRLRLWDSCGYGLFTIHTSGHNPREIQSHRWRQRVMHKFSYMPERLHSLGCTGCGRCSRACPADMNILKRLINISEEQK